MKKEPHWKREFRDSGLFCGWTVVEVLNGLEEFFTVNQRSNPKRLLLILRPRFRRDDLLLQLRRYWGNGHWSLGYCYYIAELAKIILINACKEKQFVVKSIEEKKAKLNGLQGQDDLKKHFVLHYDGVCFDPERGFAVGQNPSTKKASFRSHPSINAMLLLAYFVEHLANKHPEVSLAKLKPVLLARLKFWLV